jgi:hypothetical protein
MECWIFPKNALSQKDRIGAHVVVDRGKVGHRNPQGETKELAGENETKRKSGKERKLYEGFSLTSAVFG